MKSGKYCLGYKQTLKTLRNGKSKLVIIPITPLLSASLRSSTTLCWPRQGFTITPGTITNLEPHVENISACVLCPLPTQEILTLSEQCLVLRVARPQLRLGSV